MPPPTQPRKGRAPVSNHAAHAITTTKSAVVEVLAAPGSGKSHTLLDRAEHLLAAGTPARQILLLSFSNAAVGELKRRAQTRAAAQAKPSSNANARASNLAAIPSMTVHALALQLSGGGDVLTDNKAVPLLSKVIGQLMKAAKKGTIWKNKSDRVRKRRADLLKQLREKSILRAVLALFSFAAAADCTVIRALDRDRFEDLREFQHVLPALRNAWGRIKREDCSIDYGDMLRRGRWRIEKGRARFEFTHILVDEFQDASPAQVALFAALAALPGRSLMVFGDPGQAIFGFAGAAYTPLSSVLDGVEIMRLPYSRRLTPQTAALASAVAGLKGDAAIRTDKPDGVMPVLVTSKHELAQAKRIAADIRKLIDTGVPASQIAVLGRVKALLGLVERELLAVGVRSNPLHGKRDRKHVLRVLRLVRVIERAKDRGEKVREESVRKALKRIEGDVDAKRWAPMVTKLRAATKLSGFAGRYRDVAQAYVTLVFGARTEEGTQVLHGLNAWAAWSGGCKSAAEMMAAVKGMTADGVTLGTIHAAKGREWCHVLVVGVTDGVLPWFHATDAVALAEERNLMYVAITRARDAVRLYHAPYVHAGSRMAFEDLSRFLEAKRVQALMQADSAPS